MRASATENGRCARERSCAGVAVRGHRHRWSVTMASRSHYYKVQGKYKTS